MKARVREATKKRMRERKRRQRGRRARIGWELSLRTYSNAPARAGARATGHITGPHGVARNNHSMYLPKTEMWLREKGRLERRDKEREGIWVETLVTFFFLLSAFSFSFTLTHSLAHSSSPSLRPRQIN